MKLRFPEITPLTPILIGVFLTVAATHIRPMLWSDPHISIKTLLDSAERSSPFLIPLALYFFVRNRSRLQSIILYATVFCMDGWAGNIYFERVILHPDRKDVFLFTAVVVPQCFIAIFGAIAFWLLRPNPVESSSREAP